MFNLKIESTGAHQLLAITSGILSGYNSAARENSVVSESLSKGHKSLAGRFMGELVRTAAMVDQVVANLKRVQNLANELNDKYETLNEEEKGVLKALVSGVNYASDNYETMFENLKETVFDYENAETTTEKSNDLDEHVKNLLGELGLKNAKLTNEDDLGENVPDVVRDLVKMLRASGNEVKVRSIKTD